MPLTALHEPGAKLILVRLGSMELAIDVAAVREIRGWSEPSRLIGAPPHVSGVISLRGVTLPIVHLGARLCVAAAAPGATSVIIVVQPAGSAPFGVVVDAVSDLVRVARHDIQPPTGLGAGGDRIVTGLIARGDQILSVISPDRLLEPMEPESLTLLELEHA